jgi:hypothetical protein
LYLEDLLRQIFLLLQAAVVEVMTSAVVVEALAV